MAAQSGSVIVTGIKSIDRRLKALEPKLQRKVLRQSMRSGLEILAAEIKAQAPVDRGATRDAVQVRAVRKKKRGSIEYEARVKGTKRTIRTSAKTGKSIFYPAVVEYGDALHEPDPFVRRALDNKGEEARQVTIEGLRRGIETEASGK